MNEGDFQIRFGFTLLAAISLSLQSVTAEGDLDPPLTRVNLTRLRDDIEAALLTGTPLDQPKGDVEAGLLGLIASRLMLDAGTPLTGPPDLIAALTPERVEEAIRHTLAVLDAGPTVSLMQA